jgi:PPM family protein phosphatase
MSYPAEEWQSALPLFRAVVGGRTDAGQRRTENQDAFVIGDLIREDAGVTIRGETEAGDSTSGEAVVQITPRGVLLLVADGMGGAAAGRLASGLAASFVLAELREAWTAEPAPSPERFAVHLSAAVENANRRIHQHAQRNPETRGMGSTLTAAGLLEGVVYIAQVGDSRAYLVRDGVATQLTRDQSLVQHMIDSGALLPEDAERASHGNVILQALGVRPDVEVDLTTQDVRRGDFLLLCSDGLHRVVNPVEFAGIIAQHQHRVHAACSALVDLANERGAPDNVTVVGASFDGAGLLAPQPDDTVGRRTAGRGSAL